MIENIKVIEDEQIPNDDYRMGIVLVGKLLEMSKQFLLTSGDQNHDTISIISTKEM